MRQVLTSLLLAGTFFSQGAMAQTQAATNASATSDESSDAFALGQIIVTAPRADGVEIDSNTLSARRSTPSAGFRSMMR